MVVTTVDDVDLWFELDGDGPTVLLVPGRGDATDIFPAELGTALRAGGLSVLRWDPRDAGLSGDGGDTYTVSTLADDAVHVLDAVGVDQVHVVGLSMAGLVMTHLATRYPSRVRSLTYISAMSPDPDAGMGEDFFGAVAAGEHDRVADLVHAMGDTTDTDRSWAAGLIEAGDRRAPYRAEAAVRHQEAAFRLDWPAMSSLGDIAVPTLVFHGGRDRVLPVAHAEALGSGIAGSTVTIIDDMGHIPRPRDWQTISEAIVARNTGGTDAIRDGSSG